MLRQFDSFVRWIETPDGAEKRKCVMTTLGGMEVISDIKTGSIYNPTTGFCYTSNVLRLLPKDYDGRERKTKSKKDPHRLYESVAG